MDTSIKKEEPVETEASAKANEIILGFKNQEMLKLCRNGDIYVKGNKIENDLEVYAGLKEFLEHSFHFQETMNKLNIDANNLKIEQNRFDNLEEKRTSQRRQSLTFFKQYFDKVLSGINKIERTKNKDPKQAEKIHNKIKDLGDKLLDVLKLY